MATVNIQNGTAVNFAFPTTAGGITITSPSMTGNILLQSADETAAATNERIMDEVGNVVASIWTDPHTKATLEIILKASGLAAAITATTLASLVPGTIITIGACANMPDLVATTWEVMDSKISGTNNSAKKLSLSLEKRAGITAAASS